MTHHDVPSSVSAHPGAGGSYPFHSLASACSSRDNQSYLETVWHEAGHGLVYRLHDIPVHSLQAIHPGQYRAGARPVDQYGERITDAIGLCDVGLQPWEILGDAGDNPVPLPSDRILSFMSGNVAGPVAEHLWNQDRQVRLRAFWQAFPLRGTTHGHCSGDDMTDVCANAALLARDRLAQNRNSRGHVHAMVKLFQTPAGWACLERVARALHQHGHLDAEALDLAIDLDPQDRRHLIAPFSFRMGFATRMVDDLTG